MTTAEGTWRIWFVEEYALWRWEIAERGFIVGKGIAEDKLQAFRHAGRGLREYAIAQDWREASCEPEPSISGRKRIRE